MALKDDLTYFVHGTFQSQWDIREGRKVPADGDLTLGNEAVSISGAVLYADLADSTVMVNNYPAWFAAEVYRTFLFCAARIITASGGTVTAYDGDRVMGVFFGDDKENSATRAALKIKAAVDDIIRPLLAKRYAGKEYEKFSLQFVVGVDVSPLLVTKTGTRTANDLVWVGRAANYAAKLAALPASYIYVTESIHEKLAPALRVSGLKSMWMRVRWNTFDNSIIYRTSYRLPFS